MKKLLLALAAVALATLGNAQAQSDYPSRPIKIIVPWPAGGATDNVARVVAQKLTEDEWVKTARTLKTRPPMPWWALNAMSEADLRALHRFVRTLKDPGSPAPAYLPPDKAPSPPYIQLVLPPSKPGK